MVRRSVRPASIAVALLAVCAALLLPAAPVSAQDGSTVKYYVVGEPGAALPELSDRLLGTPARAEELLRLNAGRRQPDGAVITDPDALRAGWIVVLPWDAVGPGVVVGPLPDSPLPAPTAAAEHRPGGAVLLAGVAAVVGVVCAMLFLRRIRSVRGPAGDDAAVPPAGIVMHDTIDLGGPLRRHGRGSGAPPGGGPA
ncbi:hypothetical protein [Dactylosporangium sp. CA-092794]|uniref:hypothetical protein n=1 Tax=Dactylosporangium sp. CA-092794 TaxID=3239929 RepID=UPI003D8CFFAF